MRCFSVATNVLACDVPECYTDKTNASSADARTFQGDFPTLPPPSPRALSKKASRNTSTFALSKEIPAGFGLVPQSTIPLADQDDEENPWATLG